MKIIERTVTITTITQEKKPFDYDYAIKTRKAIAHEGSSAFLEYDDKKNKLLKWMVSGPLFHSTYQTNYKGEYIYGNGQMYSV